MAQITQDQVIHTPTTAQSAPLTVAEFIEAYNCCPIEVVNREIVEMSPPEIKHVRIARNLFILLYQFATEQKLGEVWPDNAPYILDEDPRKDWVYGSRVPDVSFVARERMEAHHAEYGEEGPLRLAPDLAVEIISPNDRYSEVNKKITDYLRYGVRAVWIIDPQARTVRICAPDYPGGIILKEEDSLTGDPVLPGWSVAVAEILGEPPEAATKEATKPEKEGEKPAHEG